MHEKVLKQFGIYSSESSGTPIEMDIVLSLEEEEMVNYASVLGSLI